MSAKQIQLAVLIQDMILAFVINSAATIMNGGFTDTGVYIVGALMAFNINYIAGLIIPVEKIGCGVARFLRLKEGKFFFNVIRVFIINAIFVTIISFTIALINVGPKAEVFGIWWSSYLVLHLVGFLTSLLVEKPVMNLVKIITDNKKTEEK